MSKTRPYTFYSNTSAICSTCYRRIEAKEVIEDNRVYLLKRCLHHAPEKVLISDDAEYWRLGREKFLKVPEQVHQANTGFNWGCPYDCGICPEHEQHGCINILEITENCNLKCPICYAGSQPGLKHRPIEQIKSMLERIVANEGEPDVIQISGGEPSLHPDFFEILQMVKNSPCKHIMLNTNGIRIAKEDNFVQKLSEYMPNFEIYLQFDGLDNHIHQDLRGCDLKEIHEQAIDKLNQFNLSTTLVVTLKKGLNDHCLGDIINYASQQTCIRGVTFQPIQHAGRSENYDENLHALPLSKVRHLIAEQSELFSKNDIIPVPCHPDCIAMAYAFKHEDKLTPVTGTVDNEAFIRGPKNTIVFENDEQLRHEIVEAYSAKHSPNSASTALKKLLCCLPGVQVDQKLGYENVFRIVIMQFMDKHTLDLRNARKSCVLIAHPDGKRVIPFETYNIFYRDHLEAERLEPLRQELRPSP